MLRDELRHLIEAEMEQTSQLAVMLAAGHTYTKAREVLGMTQAEMLIARERIQRITGKWLSE